MSSQDPDPLPPLPPRDPRGHKGTFGTVVIVGGCAFHPSESDPAPPQMLGGPALAALAALRSGAGLARLALPEPILPAALAIAPSATGAPLSVDHQGAIVPHLAAAALDKLLTFAHSLALGPGLSTGPGPRALVLRAIAQDHIPIVLDADALNCLAEMPEVHRDFRAPAVLTPHLGEFRRLAPSLGLSADPAADPLEAAAALARRLGCVVVLKSAVTIVSDGYRHWTHDHPNSALATAGSGDILAGLTAGLIAQHFRPASPLSPEAQGLLPGISAPGSRTTPTTHAPSVALSLYDCARLAVRAHAIAARQWTRDAHAPAGLLATDLLSLLPAALDSLRAPPSPAPPTPTRPGR